MQNRQEPSFFFTRTTGLAQGLLLGAIMPPSNIFWISWSVSSLAKYGNWRYGCRMGVPCIDRVGYLIRSSQRFPWSCKSMLVPG